MAITTFRSPSFTLLSTLLLLLAACSSPETPSTGPAAAPESAPGAGVRAFSGARVIVGDGTVIENATFTIGPDNHYGVVGPTAAVSLPAGVTTVDLTGLTVMPTVYDTHTHLSTDRNALLADLRHRAYFGVAAAISMGADDWDGAYEMRREVIPGAALYRMAGRGLTGVETGRSTVPYWITTPEQARAAVREQAARGVDIIKIWVDDRDGQYTKLTPEIYGAAIDEAHRNGLRATAHIFALEDAKELVRRGIDAFAHGVRDRDIDDEFVALLKQHPNVAVVPNLPDPGLAVDMSWLAGALSPEELARVQAAAVDNAERQAFHAIQARNLARLSREGVTILMGTDGNVPWAPHLEMADMVRAGMTPADVIMAATRNSAEFLRIADAGTVAPGRSADFLVLEANPLDDIANTRRIRDVYLRGEHVDRSRY